MSDGTGSKVQELVYLLDEYKYRHDLIWRLLFRLTLTVVVLSYMPYVPYGDKGSVAAVFQLPVLALPALAVLLTSVGIKVFLDEFDHFWRVVLPYHALQDTFFADTFPDKQFTAHKPTDKEKDRFRNFVLLFLIVLWLATFVNVAGLVCGYRSSSRPFALATRPATQPSASSWTSAAFFQ